MSMLQNWNISFDQNFHFRNNISNDTLLFKYVNETIWNIVILRESDFNKAATFRFIVSERELL